MSKRKGMSIAWLWLAPLLLVMLVLLVQWLPLVTPQQTGADALDDAQQVATSRLYTPLELRGRDIYLREGCVACHSQMVRPLVRDLVPYGRPSGPQDSSYDRPVQWGMRRYGPDLSYVGAKYPPGWHRLHLTAPRTLSADSKMPAYPWLGVMPLSYADVPGRMRVLRDAGLPYSLTREELLLNIARFGEQRAALFDIHSAEKNLLKQASARDYDGNADRLSELDALIAYLEVLGSAPTTADVAEGRR